MIVCRTLGPIEVLVDGVPAPAELLWRKNLALLIYLARSPKRARTRDHLTALLWPDKPQSAARHSLREAVRVLRSCAGDAAVDAAGDSVRLAADLVMLDVDRLADLHGAGRWAEAAELVAGEFLEGFGVPDASAFEDWLAAERLEWRKHAVDVLVHRVDERLHTGDVAGAGQLALKALRLDPLSETGAAAAMAGLALAGDRAGALKLYEELRVRLAAAGGIEPGASLRSLADRVRRERVWRAPGTRPPAEEAGAESRRAPLVGRERELGLLLDTWAAVRDRREARLGLVLGDPGAGKTRLIEELVSRARLDGAAVAAVTAVPADRGEPWNGTLGFARGGLLGAAGLASAQPAALATFAATIPAWADRFGGVTPGVTLLSPGRALSEVLTALSEEQPVVLAADDAHWLDQETLAALAGVLRDLAQRPLLVVLGAPERGEAGALDGLRAQIGRDLRGASVRVGPLDQPGLQALARWALPKYTGAELERVTRRLAVDSAGLPLLAVDILHAVALGMDLGETTGAWPQPFKTLDQTLPSDLPDAVVAAIRVGFGRLSSDAKKALSAVAVLADRVDQPTIARVTGLTGEALHRALDELEWERWLGADPRGYTFVARIVRDVVGRDMVTPGQRQRLLGALNQ